jgi:hypothetical protein
MMMLAPALALAVPQAAPPPVALQAHARPAVIERTLLKAFPGKRDALARFVAANWLALDRRAVEQGLFTGYRLVENAAADADWDLAVEVGYHGRLGFDDADVQRRFAAIRAAHVTVPIDGQTLAQLGRIVRSERVRLREEG